MASESAVPVAAQSGGRGANIALWVAQALAAFAFLGAGFAILSGAPMMVASFDKLGLGQWFRYVTGGLEVIGALLLLVPAASGLGGLLLSGIMIGAVTAHLFVLGGSPMAALILLVLVGLIAWGRRASILKLLQRQ